GKAATAAVASSAATVLAAKLSGRKSRSDPTTRAVTAAAGSLGTSIGGGMLGQFARNLIGGLMR
ncbi:MAG: ATP-binding protein, partial [Pontixanthobacter sp.]